MFDFIAYPIGKFLKLIYNTLAFKNYGLSIILLTVAVKTILLPLTIKQYRSTSGMSKVQPKMQELQKKYKNDPEKLNQEMMKLYKEYNVNPASGCLPLFIQMPILFSLYYVISQPLKYMFGMSPKLIQQLFNMLPANAQKLTNLHDLSIIRYFTENTDKLPSANGLITNEHLLNMKFFGIDLGSIPSLDYHKLFGVSTDVNAWLLLIVPVLAVATTYLSIRYSSNQTPKSDSNPTQDSTQKSMALISPIMTGFISFTVPAGMGLYWIISNILQLLQQKFINKLVLKNHNS
jgi:YidC/Oxa1 family membrane protein insertase